MQTLRIPCPVVGAALLACVACFVESPAPSSPTIVDLGVHEIGLTVPPDWLHADHGMEQRFENGMARISLVDLGPATPEGFADTLREARALFEKNQWEDARTLLVATRPRRFFPSEQRWHEVQRDWKRITSIRREQRPGKVLGPVAGDVDWEVKGAFHDLLMQASSLPSPTLPALARSALPELGHGEQRSIASEEAAAISGRPALRIESWDRLSHVGRKRYLFVLSAGRLLCLWTKFGPMETVGPAFESLAASLTIERPQDGGDVGGDREASTTRMRSLVAAR